VGDKEIGVDMNNSSDKFGLWQFFILIISIYILVALFVVTVFKLPKEVVRLIEYSDTIICFIFIFDFSKKLYTAQNKLHYLKWGWIDLISSIPAFDFLRVGRIVRIFRFFVF
jgi:voltage-gated potassium channel